MCNQGQKKGALHISSTDSAHTGSNHGQLKSFVYLLRFARYAAKDGKIIDEITQAELSSGAELPFIHGLLAKPGDTSADIGASLAQPNSPR